MPLFRQNHTRFQEARKAPFSKNTVFTTLEELGLKCQFRESLPELLLKMFFFGGGALV